MKFPRKPISAVLLVASIGVSGCFRKPEPKFSGTVAENFAALDQNGELFELYRNRFSESTKAVVLLTTGVGCPVAEKYLPSINELSKKYAPQGVRFYLVNSNPQDDRAKIVEAAKSFAIEPPVLLDASQAIADSLKLARTSEAVLIETRGWHILYQGSIDDQRNVCGNPEKSTPTKKYLEEAIQAYLGNSEIKVAKTDSSGCIISRFDWPKAITYREHVAPILAKHCTFCHRPNGDSPENFSSYADVKGWAPMIREVIRTKKMPPWEPDSTFGPYRGDSSLSAREAGLVLKWIDAGAPEGTKKVRPLPIAKLREYPVDVVYGPYDTEIPAASDKRWEYIPLGVAPKDFWVSARRVLISNKKWIQHVALLVTKKPLDLSHGAFEPQDSMQREDLIKTIRFSPFIQGWFDMGPGLAEKIPAGAHLYLELHLALNGQKGVLKTQLQLSEHRGPKPPKEIFYHDITTTDLNIPAGARRHSKTVEWVLPSDIALVAFGTHMHMHGLSMKLLATHPNGRVETVFSVPNFIYNNRTPYYPENPIRLEAGTKLEATATWDNSPSNPYGIDFTKPLRFGPAPDSAEMFDAHLWYYQAR